MGSHVLFVDDEEDLEPLIRQIFRRPIRKNELSVSFARNGLEGLNLVKNNADIEVVFSDINMPEMDGLTMLEKLRVQNQNFCVVMISGYGDMKNIRTAMNRGAFDFIVKPIDKNDLKTTLSKSLEYIRAIRDGREAEQRAMKLDVRNKFIRDVFGRYMSEQVVNNLLDSPEGLDLGGQKRVVSIMMTDLRGFSVLSAKHAASDVIQYLNRYLEMMINIVLKHEGTIIEIIGDGIFVIFGAPVQQEDHVIRSISCAIEMQIAMYEFNKDHENSSFPRLEMGIGINTGEAVVGNIGSQKRAKYGAVGKNVNLAARIESFTIGNQILISESAYQQVADQLIVASTSTTHPKGEKNPINLYEIRGIVQGASLPTTTVHIQALPQKQRITFSVLKGKHIDTNHVEAFITHMSDQSVFITASYPLAPMLNLKLNCQAPTGGQEESFFGKVIRCSSDADDGWEIQFTSISAEARQRLQVYLSQAVS